METNDLLCWTEDYSGSTWIWYAKRLSGNDTLANGTHQAGPYIPRELLFSVFPSLERPDLLNPDVQFDLYVDSHNDQKEIRAVWYNNKLHGGTRNETRLTNFGGVSSALLDPDNTGALTVFAFYIATEEAVPNCHVWVCRSVPEEHVIEDRIGPVEPGKWRIWPRSSDTGLLSTETLQAGRTDCWLSPCELPAEWLYDYPSGAEIIRKSIELQGSQHLNPDSRLLKRRTCEYQIFQSLEEAKELPVIRLGFNSIEEFTDLAQTILQRRKARSGRSLELHIREIFLEEGLTEGHNFSHGSISEAGKRPDFLFPSESSYKNASYPSDQLRMLAVKTTCRDRWRQILNEAERIPRKHLLTLQEGVSENQFGEMMEADVQLVVPGPLFNSFPSSVRPHLQSFEDFIGEVRGG